MRKLLIFYALLSLINLPVYANSDIKDEGINNNYNGDVLTVKTSRQQNLGLTQLNSILKILQLFKRGDIDNGDLTYTNYPLSVRERFRSGRFESLINGTKARTAIGFYEDNGTGLYKPIDNGLALSSNGITSIYSDPKGNIGINTLNAEALLTLNGSFILKDGSQANNKVLTSNANGLASWSNLGDLSVDSTTLNGFSSDDFLKSNGSDTYSAGTLTFATGTLVEDANLNGDTVIDNGNLYITTSTPTAGYVLTTDGNGLTSWASAASLSGNGDNLGNHIASSNLNMSNKSIVNILNANGTNANFTNITASSTINGTSFNGTTFTGGTFNGTFIGDGSGLTGVTASATGSTGYIQYNDSGSLGANGDLYWDITNSRLALGHTSPDTRIDIKGALTLRDDSLTVGVINADGETENGTASATITVDQPTGLTQNDLMIAFVYEAGTGSITYSGPAGWTVIDSFNYGSGANAISGTLLYKVAGASEAATYTFTPSGAISYQYAYILNYDNADTLSPIGNYTIDTGAAASSNIVAPNITTGRNNSIVLRGGAYDLTATGGWVGFNNGHTMRAISVNPAGFGDKLQSSAGSTSTSTSDWGLAGGESYVSFTMELHAQGSSGDPITPDNGSSIFWRANSSSYGNNGDYFASIRQEGTTKVIRIIDFNNGRLATDDASSDTIFNGLTLNGLTANRLVKTDSNKKLASETTLFSNGGNIGIGIANPVAHLHIGTGSPEETLGTDDAYISGDLEVDGIIYGNGSGLIGINSVSEINDLSDAKSNTANGSLFLGFTSGAVNTSSSNTGVGFYSLSSNTSGSSNTALGIRSLTANTTGYSNVAVGDFTLAAGISGAFNTAVGSTSLGNITTGSSNTSVGAFSMVYTDNGSRNNTAIGYKAGYGVDTNEFSNGTLLGYKAGESLTTGDNNIFIGYQAGNGVTTGASNIIIGYDNEAPSSTASNQLDIADTIYGDTSAGNIGIGGNLTTERLNVNGAIMLDNYSSLSGISGTEGFGKIAVNGNELYFIDNGGNATQLGAGGGGSSEWSDQGTFLHPADNSGIEDIVIGATDYNNGSIILYNGGAATFNENGNVADFRIESNGDANAFFFNGTSGYLGLGLVNPSAQLHVGTGAPEESLSSDDVYISDDLELDGTLYGVKINGTTINASGTITGATVNATTMNATNFYGTFNGSFFGDGSGLTGVVGGNGNWLDGGTFIYPADNTGDETVIVGDNDVNNGDIILYNGGAATFNEQGLDQDFRIEAETEQYMVFVDASENRVAIGHETPDTHLDLDGHFTIRAASVTTANGVLAYQSQASNGADMEFPNTAATSIVVSKPSGVAENDFLIAFISALDKTVSVNSLPSGWTEAVTDSHTSSEVMGSVLWKKATASEPSTYTFGFSESVVAVALVMKYNGVNLTSPIAGSNSAEGSASDISPDISFPAIAGLSDNYRVLRLMAGSAGQMTDSFNGSSLTSQGYTQRFNDEGDNTAISVTTVYDKQVSTSIGTLTGNYYFGMPPGSIGYVTFTVALGEGSTNTDPLTPDNGSAVFWVADGSVYGNNGDFLARIKEDGGDKVIRIIDYNNGRLATDAVDSNTIFNGLTLNGLTANRLVKTDSNKALVSETTLFSNGGNIGIGIATPVAHLHIGTGAPEETLGTDDAYISGDLEVDGIIYGGTFNGTFLGNGAGLTGVTATVAINDLTDAVADTYSVYLGSGAGDAHSGNTYNTALGVDSLKFSDADNTHNTAIGYQSLYTSNGGNHNSGVGYQSLYSNTIGYYNNAFGDQSLYSNTIGYRNTALGDRSLYYNSSGNLNTASGTFALYQNTTGDDNVAMGDQALYSTTTGSNNVAIGALSLWFTDNGSSNNTAIGYKAGEGTLGEESSNGVYLGYKTGANLTTGDNNVFIGYQAGDNVTSGATNLIIGYDNDAPSAIASNQLDIADTIYGDTSAKTIGINITDGSASFTVNGTTAYSPSSVTNIVAGTGITVTNTIMRVQGSGGAVNITANPQIADGVEDGQIVILKGSSDTNTLTLDDGDGLALNNDQSFTMGNMDTMTLMYDAVDDIWIEINRSNN